MKLVKQLEHISKRSLMLCLLLLLLSGLCANYASASAETVMVKNINTQTVPVSIYSSVTGRGLVNVNGTIFFSVNGNELWKSDGTDSGTVMVKSFDGGVGIDSDGSVSVNGTLFFSAWEEVNGAGGSGNLTGP
jgi:ELWxxDGT repeat protein